MGVALALAIWSASFLLAFALFMLQEGYRIEDRGALLPWVGYAVLMAVSSWFITRKRRAFTGAAWGAIVGLVASLSLLFLMAFSMTGIEPGAAIWILVVPSCVAGAATGWTSSLVATSHRWR